MKFYNYLNELKFVPGRDQDYIVKSNGVVIFNPNDEYKVQGKTHNITSHALKHLKEFDYNAFSSVIEKAKEYINLTNFYLLNKSGKLTRNPKSIGFAVTVNTLDRINDKILNGKNLTKEEKYLTKFLNEITKVYERFINDVYLRALNIDDYNIESIKKLNENQTVVFTVYDPNKHEYIVNFKKLYFGVKSKKGIKTFYIANSFNKMINKLLSVDFENREIKRFIRHI